LINDPQFYLTAVLAVIIIGVAKGGLAGGIGMVGVPLMALTIGPVRAAAIMLPILMVMDLLAVRAYWFKWKNIHLVWLLPGAALGTLAGWLSFQYLSVSLLKLMVGLVAVTYSTSFWWKRKNADGSEERPLAAVLWGSLSGFTSFSIHAGGPPLHSYLLGRKLDRTEFQATTVAFFFLVNWMKLGPYYLLDQLNFDNLLTSLFLLPLAPLGIYLGTALHQRIKGNTFYKVIYVSLFLIGLKLCWEGIEESGLISFMERL